MATANLDLFSRVYLFNSDRRARLQSELYLITDDICKNVARATGDISNPAIWVTGTTTLNVNQTSGSAVVYTFTGNRIEKDGNPINIHRVIANFTPSSLHDGIGVELNITGRYNVTPPAGINNPEVNVTTRCYSRSASSR